MSSDIKYFRESWETALRLIDASAAREAARQAIDSIGLQSFGDAILTPTLEAVGEVWESGEISLAEVYMAGKISNEVLSEYAQPSEHEDTDGVAVVMLDDRHGLGKNLVLAALQVARLPVRDLGTLSAREIADRVRDENIGLLLVSTLMLRSALRVKDLMSYLKEDGTKTRVIVGGAPFRLDPELWRQVGADKMGSDSAEAVSIVKNWLRGES